MSQRVAVIGAGWAGLAAAVKLTQTGHSVSVFEASRLPGGRARALPRSQWPTLAGGTPVPLDNGQHILIGAYRDTLQLLRAVQVDPAQTLLSLPMTLRFPDGEGLAFGTAPTPLDALLGVLGARGWTWHDKLQLLRETLRWQFSDFDCPDDLSVDELCRGLPHRVRQTLIEPLCVSALNTPASHASARVLLRVLRDGLFGPAGGSRLLLPRVDLGALFPEAAVAWLTQHGAQVRTGRRVACLARLGHRWQVQEESFDHVVLATASHHAVRLLRDCPDLATPKTLPLLDDWVMRAQDLRFEAIATVYAWAPQASLPQAMLALRPDALHPAQFVFDRGQLCGPAGLLAFVVSAASAERDWLQTRVLAQAREQLGLELQALQTVVEKRATFACTPGLQRPGHQIAPGLFACGDYVAGPYPATLEGAVRSALTVADAITRT